MDISIKKYSLNLILKYDDIKLIILRSRSRDFYTALNILTPHLLSCTACNKTTLPLILNQASVLNFRSILHFLLYLTLISDHLIIKYMQDKHSHSCITQRIKAMNCVLKQRLKRQGQRNSGSTEDKTRGQD